MLIISLKLIIELSIIFFTFKLEQGISDNVDYSSVAWRNGRYDTEQLSNIYTSNDTRVANIIENLVTYSKDYRDVCAVGFCVSQDHAKFMARKFNDSGLQADYLIAENASRRADVLMHSDEKTSIICSS